MKILHTADWHLGKRLEKFSRFEEQREVMDEICTIADQENRIVASIAEFERDLIKERTKAGMEAARARGRKGGRPKKVSDKAFGELVKLYDKETLTVEEIVNTAGISRVTFYRRLHAIRKDK